jgi:predicted  nucleic acid-binding Zn-ribbon protein
MSVKRELETLVRLQARELEVVRIRQEIAAAGRARAAAKAEVAAAERQVGEAEAELEAARGGARRLDVDLKAAEDKVGKYKDQLIAVRTNEQLWALQEEIRHAEAAMGDVETRILEHLERADALERAIAERRSDRDEVGKRAAAAVAAADRQEAELTAAKKRTSEAIAELRERLPADLLKTYDGIKAMRAGVGVAEARDEVCMVCNFRMRPQLYVEAANLAGIVRCESCKRILYVAERLELGRGEAAAGAGPAAVLRGSESGPGIDPGGRGEQAETASREDAEPEQREGEPAGGEVAGDAAS